MQVLDPVSPVAPMVLFEGSVYDPASALFAYTAGDSIAGIGGTFTRSGAVATYFDANGLLQTVGGSNVLRDGHYINGVRTTLVEPNAATNIQPWNRDLTQSNWTNTNGSLSHAQTGITGVASSASFFQALAVDANVVGTSIVVSPAFYTISAYVKRLSGTGLVSLSYNGGSSYVDFAGVTSTTSWTRLTIVTTVAVASVSAAIKLATNGDQIAVDFIQVETGTLATSPIATTAGAVTRNAERLTFTTTATPQRMRIALSFYELGATQSSAGVFAIGESVNESIMIGASSGLYAATHRKSSDVTSPQAAGPQMGDAVNLRLECYDDGSVQLIQSINGADEVLASPSSVLAYGSAFSAGVIALGDRGSGTGAPVAIQSLRIQPANTLIAFGTARDYRTKTSDLPNPNLLTNTSDLASAGWSHAQSNPTNAAATVNGVSLSRVSNVGTPNAVSTTASLPFSKIATKRCSFTIKHDNQVGQDLQLLYDNTGTVALARVDETFNADGTITFTLTTGNRIEVYPLGGGAYDVIVESIPFTSTHLAHSVIFFASDAGGAGFGAGSVPTFLIGNIRVEDEIPAIRLYRGRLANPGTLTLDIISAWAKGLAPFGIGQIKLNNDDGALDSLRRYVFDGNPFSMYLATLDNNGRLSRQLLYSGIMEQPDCDLQSISITVRSMMYGLDRPVLSATFAGTGAIAGSLEGDANVAGKIKPRIYGWGANVEPTIVDQGNVVYHVSDRPFYMSAAFDEGLALTLTSGGGAHSEYATLALLIAATVSVGHWSYAIDNGVTYIRLHLAAQQLTVFGCSMAPTSGATLEALLSQLLADANVSPTTVVCDGHYPVTPAGTYPVANLGGVYGLVLTDTTSYADAIAALVSSVAGWLWLNTVSNVWVLGQLPNNATGEAVQCIVSNDDIEGNGFARIGNPKNPGEGIPPWQVNVNYDRFALVQSNGLAAAVDAGWRARASREFLTRAKTRSSVKLQYPLAQSIDITGGGCLSDGSVLPMGVSVGQTLADQFFDSLNLGYEFFRITLKSSPKLLARYTAPAGGGYTWVPATMPSFRGAVLGVKSTRYGFTTAGNGTKCHVLNVTLDLTARTVTLIVATRFLQG